MYIKVKTVPDAREEQVKKVGDDTFVISVCEPAEMNQANRRVLEIIRAQFPKAKDIRIVNGHHSTSKILAVELE